MGQNATSSRDQLTKTFQSATRAATIVPSDVVAGNQVFHSLYVGGAGDVSVVFDDDTTAVFKAVPVGTTLQCSGKRINATGTTATFMLGLLW